MYKRVVLKISGEQLTGQYEHGIDPAVARYYAEEIKKVQKTGCQIVVVVGGGNMVRGAEVAKGGIKRVTADQMGMLSGLINAMAMTDIFESCGIATRCLSNVFAEQVAESFSFRLAEKHLQNGRVLIVAGGTGRPYSTHDTAAVLIGLEMDCELVLKATKVDGVYDKDPEKYSDAVHLPVVSYQQALENAAIKVMDKAAMGLAMEHDMPLVIYDSMKPDSFVKIIQGDTSIGTRIS